MRVPIAQRPTSVNSRKHIGHWEGDTVIGAGHKQAIVTLVECKSGMALLAKVPFEWADLVA
jgi:IS30 family transposase